MDIRNAVQKWLPDQQKIFYQEGKQKLLTPWTNSHVLRPPPLKLGHVCFRSTDSDMLLQYQTLTQGSDPEEQPLGSLVPSRFFPFSSNSCVTQWFRIHQWPATVKMDVA
ncbi:hypothetical protein NPIL_34011 [Nephila pilipes]|uniref:Uncharacterized protein n=1 Tax=Nephila pilipes TaxID=299642 RepID=A0A8X6P3W7_NEPPI|nr:hypothetical protein NPIL_34011 [Nephila pilipes]